MDYIENIYNEFGLTKYYNILYNHKKGDELHLKEKRNKYIKFLQQFSEDSIILPDYEEALVGVTSSCRAIYSEKLILEKLMRTGMSREQAEEKYCFEIEPISCENKYSPLFILDI